MKIITLLLVVMSLVLLGFNVYMGLIFKRPKIIEKNEVVKIQDEIPQKQYIPGKFNLGKFTINLVNEAQDQGQRFVQTAVEVDYIAQEPGEVETLQAKLQDIIIQEISFRKISQLDSLHDKIELKAALIQSFNKKLSKSIVKDVYFDNFTIQ